MDNDKKTSNIFQTAFDNLRNKITKGLYNKASDQVDTILDKVGDSIINKDSMNYSEMIRSAFSGAINSNMFQNVGTNILMSPDTIGRFIRYANAEEICDNIPYCARALKLIADEVVAPDNITKEILQFLEDGSGTTENKEFLSNVRSINETIKLDDHIHEIVYETLKLGDNFVEICDFMSQEVPVTQALLYERRGSATVTTLTEGIIDGEEFYEEPDFLNEVEVTIPGYMLSEKSNEIIEENVTISVKPQVVEEVSKDDEKKDFNITSTRSKPIDISRIRLILHDPRFVVKLQSNRFKMCLGYLILPRPSISDMQTFIPGRGYFRGSSQGLQTPFFAGPNYKDMMGIDRIYSDIMNVVKRHIGSKDVLVDKKEVMNLIARAISEFDQEERMEFKVRYVPSERMEHFCLSSRRFFPYGEGIFYKTTFSAKLLIAFETALVIKRISDSSDKRVMYIETGLPRNVRNLVEEVREALKKRKFSVDTMGNIGSIPCLALDTKIRMTSGNSLTLQEIIEQFNFGKNLEVYCYDHETGKVLPDKIVKARITGNDVEVIKVTLDNNKEIVCTPDHLFMLRGGNYIKAEELKVYDSLMPLYRKSTKYSTNKGYTYELLYHPGNDNWELTHRTFGEYLGLVETGDKKIIHHSDNNSRNNSRWNLQGLTRSEHCLIHAHEENGFKSSTKKLTYSKKCTICGKTFEKDYRKQTDICSRECFKKYRKTYSYASWITRQKEEQYQFINETCSNCGKEIKITNATFRARNGKYLCCKDEICKRRTDVLNRIIARNPSASMRIEYRKCITCGKIFISRIEEEKRACSVKCSNQEMILRRWGGKTNLFDYNCDNCGKEIKITNRTFGRYPYHSCDNLVCRKRIQSMNLILKKSGKQFSEIEYANCSICGKFTIFNEKKPGYYYLTCGSKSCSISAMQRGITRFQQVMNHKVKSIEKLTQRITVGDIETEKFHNFGLDSGIFVHNSMITSYEEFFIPQNKGKKYLEFDTLPSPLNLRDISDELKLFRDVLISSLEVPPAFLSSEENLNSKSALSQENIIFSRTITSYQARMSKPLRGMFSKIYKLVYNNVIPPSIKITFAPPKMLQVERETEHFEIVSRLINSLVELGIDREYLKKKYISIDWDELKQFEIQSELESKLRKKQEEEEALAAQQQNNYTQTY